MKYILTALGIALIGLLCGCANLETFLRPPNDPTLVATDATTQSAQTWVSQFLAYEQANPNVVGLDARTAARNLRERFDGDLKDLLNTKSLYLANPTDANRSRLLMALESVQTAQSIAQGYLGGRILPQHGLGAPFAPPLGSGPPPLPQIDLSGLYERFDKQDAKLNNLASTVARIGLMVHSITNQTTEGDGTVTNKPPPLPE